MPDETLVPLKVDSVSLFEALRTELGDWKLQEHPFNPGADELHVSYDSGGTGRVALTIVFELDATQMARIIDRARPAR